LVDNRFIKLFQGLPQVFLLTFLALIYANIGFIMHDITVLLNKFNIDFVHTGLKNQKFFSNFSGLSHPNSESLIFINKPGEDTLAAIKDSEIAIVLIAKIWAIQHLSLLEKINQSIFIVDHPRWVVAKIMAVIYPDEDNFEPGIHPTAIVYDKAQIHPSVSIGPFCIIGNCKIGKGSRIDAYTKIYDGSVLGKNVTVREHCVIGGPGFGYAVKENSEPARIPHIGKAVIEDNVEIFPFANVDRATFGETRICKGAKIDHYSHISHNTKVGSNSIITAGTILCGGSSVGKNTWAGIGCIIKEKIPVGDNVTIGMGAVVLKPVPDGQVIAGIPAKPLKSKS
jgi:UDP-3-O-[3-hydroxymyristoyl] glucosamine N-acyltransferase